MIDMSKLYECSDYEEALDNFNRSRNSNRWNLFKQVHLKVANNKCPICECPLDDSLTRESNNGNMITIGSTIDHYRPKCRSLYPLLKYDHKNYLLMCSDCNNVYKGSQFPLFGDGAQRENSVNTTDEITCEKPLIVNPIYDKPLDLFKLEFKYTATGRKVLELAPNNEDEYKRAKAEETISLFGLGECSQLNDSKVNNCRISTLNKHFRMFYDFIDAIKKRNREKAIRELKEKKLDKYGFYDFIKANQYDDLIS